MTPPPRSYEKVAPVYDALSYIYSGGAIQTLADFQAQHIWGGRALFAGAGSAREAVLAARKGAAVTCIDISPSMCRRAERRLASANCSGEILCESILEHRPLNPYDAIVANFFLDVFDAQAMQQILRFLVSILAHDGLLQIGDFAAPCDVCKANFPARLVRYWHHSLANVGFWAGGLCPLQEMHCYPAFFESVGLASVDSTLFRLFGVGPAIFVNHRAIRVTAENPRQAEL